MTTVSPEESSKKTSFMSKRTQRTIFWVRSTFYPYPEAKFLTTHFQSSLKLGISGFAWLGLVAAGIVSVTPPFTQGRPEAALGVWASVHSFLTIKAFASVLALNPPEASSSIKNSTSNPKTNTSSASSRLET
jgi:hypothetical protein